jgi:hypothetical protein
VGIGQKLDADLWPVQDELVKFGLSYDAQMGFLQRYRFIIKGSAFKEVDIPQKFAFIQEVKDLLPTVPVKTEHLEAAAVDNIKTIGSVPYAENRLALTDAASCNKLDDLFQILLIQIGKQRNFLGTMFVTAAETLILGQYEFWIHQATSFMSF